MLGQVSIEELLTPGMERRGLKCPAPPLGVCVFEVDVPCEVWHPYGSRQCRRTKIYAVVMTDRAGTHVQTRRVALTNDEFSVGSQRTRGVADSLAASAAVVVQAKTLAVAHVMRIAPPCCGDACVQDVCAVGGMLVLLYGCACVSDG